MGRVVEQTAGVLELAMLVTSLQASTIPDLCGSWKATLQAVVCGSLRSAGGHRAAHKTVSVASIAPFDPLTRKGSLNPLESASTT